MERHPFKIDAFVLLPDHLHCIWTLPHEDRDFSKRWRLIKSDFSRQCVAKHKTTPSASRLRKKEQAIWQRRFWEHQIRKETDFINHVEYIHYNPVKHRLVQAPKDWEYSSFHRYVREGIYDVEWGARKEITFDSCTWGE
jgi:putative transposase